MENNTQKDEASQEISALDQSNRHAREKVSISKIAIATIKQRPWEKSTHLTFDPRNLVLRTKSLVNYKRDSILYTASSITAENAYEKLMNEKCPHISTLPFSNPDAFVAGQLHKHFEEWNAIISNDTINKDIVDWLRNGVNIEHYIVHFKGRFWGQSYDHDFPPPRIFQNSNTCEKFTDFISDTISERLKNGSIECVGRVGEVDPPYIVSPLTVEPNKPRLCLNLKYLNNWIKDVSFKPDTLSDIPRVVKQGAYFTTIDDKSGFDNVFLAKTCHRFLGFQWAGYYFLWKSLPFGFKLSPYIYHTLNLVPTSYIRTKFNIPIFLYIDDRLVEEIRTVGIQPGSKNARASNYIVCQVLTRLGYCINLTKTIFEPTQRPLFLGFCINSVEECYHLTHSKTNKIAVLRESCLKRSLVYVFELKQLYRLCSSFLPVFPAARLYTREMNAAILQGLKNKKSIKMSDALKEEVRSWIFLDKWCGRSLKWKKEGHLSLEFHFDAPTLKWNVTVYLENNHSKDSGILSDSERNQSTTILNVHALLNALSSVKDDIRGYRVYASVDNKALLYTWNKNCSDCSVLKQLFQFLLDNDIVLKLVPSVVNVDLDSKAKCNFEVNVFSQIIYTNKLYYFIPKSNLTLPFIAFLRENKIKCTVVLSTNRFTPVWMPAYYNSITDAVLIGSKGDQRVLMYPFELGLKADCNALQNNLWAIDFSDDAQDLHLTYGKLVFCKQPTITMAHDFLLIGDSAIDFLSTHKCYRNPMVHVVSAVCINEILQNLHELARKLSPRLILIHLGVNNLNNTDDSITDSIECSIKKLDLNPKNTSVILSSVIPTKDTLERVKHLNHDIKQCCYNNNWWHLDNDNIDESCLRDTVHLNAKGKDVFSQNIMTLLNQIL